MTGQENAASYVDKVARCEKCAGWVERIQPHPGSQGVATWRHIIPADHVARPVEGSEEHAIRTRITPGGNVEVWCICQKWRREAPSIRAAQDGWQRHVQRNLQSMTPKREDSTDGH